ncbi:MULTISPECIES: hypothetical protein [unclassified Idiomarina]|mgnify:CR=1 FL=1|jgi:ABC-type lipoprotein release transport system permease subunit|uniref:hypothetical protein n=1 Tax=unclassified Idiomarina TaxID=2614829 RepID=UPI0025BEEE07|nr:MULTISPECIES: hypothetical protein [unclassified Idiomarina]|tara:strand:- start:902 stop:1393 length:492 start_codon:yes stop_codon:yes gene_type:complete
MINTKFNVRCCSVAFVVVILSVLAGCEPAKETSYTNSMGQETSHETQSKMHAALSFYYAIYREDDLNVAKHFASERMSQLIEHYGSVSAVQRYVLNRYFDRVEISIDPSSFKQYLNRDDEQRVTLVFDGSYDGEMVKDRRDIVLVKEKNVWRVDQILDPRYRP